MGKGTNKLNESDAINKNRTWHSTYLKKEKRDMKDTENVYYT